MVRVKRSTSLHLDQHSALDEDVGDIVSNDRVPIGYFERGFLHAVDSVSSQLEGQRVGVDPLQKPHAQGVVNSESAFENLSRQLLLWINRVSSFCPIDRFDVFICAHQCSSVVSMCSSSVCGVGRP